MAVASVLRPFLLIKGGEYMPDNNVTVDTLAIKVNAEAGAAEDKIKAMAGALGSVKSAIGGLVGDNGLSGLASSLRNISDASAGIKADSITNLSNAINNLTSVDKVNALAKGLKSIKGFDGSKTADSIRNIAGSVQLLDGIKLSTFSKGVKDISASVENTDGIKNFRNFSKSIEALNNVDVSKIGEVGVKLKELSKSISDTGLNDEVIQKSVNGITSLFNSVTRLDKIDPYTIAHNMDIIADSVEDMISRISNSEGMSSELVSLLNSIAEISKATKNTGNSFDSWKKAHPIITSLGQSVKQLAHDILNKLGNAIKSIGSIMFHPFKTLTNYLGKVSKNLFGMMMAFNMVKNGASKIWGAIEKGAGYVEAYNYYNTALTKLGSDMAAKMGEAGTESAQRYADEYSAKLNELTNKMTGFTVGEGGALTDTGDKNLGYDPKQIIEFEGQVAQLTNSAGMLENQSISTAKALTMLAADYSSLRNLDDISVAMQNLTSGLVGQTKVMYKYGVDITMATLKQTALNHGITKSVSAMTQQEKMQLRVIAMLEQSKAYYGDNAATINSVANAYRVLKQQTASLGATIGKVLMPAVAKVLPYVTSLVMILQKLFSLLGVKIHGTDWEKTLAPNKTAGFADGLEDTMDALDGVDDKMGDVADSTNAAKKAMDKFKSATIGIDELNIISPDTDTTSSGNSGSGSGVNLPSIDLSDDIDSLLDDYESVFDKALESAQTKAREIADTVIGFFKNGEYGAIGRWISNKISEALANIDWNNVYEKARAFGTGLAKFLNGLLTPELFGNLGRTLGGLLNTAIESAIGFVSTLDWEQMGTNISSFIISLFDEFDGSKLADLINKIYNGLKTAITTAISNLWDDRETIKEDIEGFFDKLDPEVEVVLGLIMISPLIKGLTKPLIANAAKTALEAILPKAAKAGTLLLSSSSIPVIGIALTGITLGLHLDAADFDMLVDDALARGEIDEDMANLMKGASIWKKSTLLTEIKLGKLKLPEITEKDLKPFKDWVDEWIKDIKDYFSERLKINPLEEIKDAFNPVWLSDDNKNSSDKNKKNTTTKGTITPVETKASAPTKTFEIKEVTITGKEDATFTAVKKNYDAVKNKSPLTTVNGKSTGSFDEAYTKYHSIQNKQKLTTSDGKTTSIFDKVYDMYHSIVDKTPKTTSDGSTTRSFDSMHDDYHSLQNKNIKVNGDGYASWDLLNLKGIWDSLYSKTIRITQYVSSIFENKDGAVYSQGRKFSPQYFAGGGFPDTGQMFVAREAGPELVGTIGSSTAVMNNSQIVESVAAGVQRAVETALNQSPLLAESNATLHRIANKDMSVNIGDRQIAEANVRGQRQLGVTIRR